LESPAAKSGHDLDVGKTIDKFMMELAAPASKHTATGSTVTCFFAVIIQGSLIIH